jgi:hypothetical protein
MNAVLDFDHTKVNLSTFSEFFKVEEENPKRVSFLKSIAEKISTYSLNKSEELISMLEIILDHMEKGTVHINIDKAEQIVKEGKTITGFVEKLLSYVEGYEIDDVVAQRIIGNYHTIKNQMQTVVELMAINIQKMREEELTNTCSLMSQESLGEIWNHEANDHWDEFLKSA